MTPTPEQIAAFADGQLEGEEAALVGQAVAASAALQAEVAAHRALRARLASHFAPLLDETPTAAQLGLLQSRDDNVVALAEIRAQRRRRGWAWIAAPALAASIAAVVLFRPASPAGYAEPGIAQMLDGQLVSEQDAKASGRVLLSFMSRDGQFCRAYSSGQAGGIACRDDRGWKIERSAGSARQDADYRQAGSDAELMQMAQDMAAGPALNADEEADARAHGWRNRR